MAYLGFDTSVTSSVLELRNNVYNGDNTTVTFSLSYPVNGTTDLEVVVDDVQYSPFDGSYSVDGANLTFTTAPNIGSNNVYVIYRNYYQSSPVLNLDSVLESYIADLAITTNKLRNGAVTTAKIASNVAITNFTMDGPAIATNTLSLNKDATSANHATQKKYVDALTIIFGA